MRGELKGKEAMANEHVFVIRCDNHTTQKYLFEFLYSNMGQSILKENITGSAQGGLNSTNLKNIQIPLPPIEIQQQIIDECAKVDEEYNTSRMTIEDYKSRIASVFADLDAKEFSLSTIGVSIIRGVTYKKEQQSDIETQNIILTADNITIDGELSVVKKIYLTNDISLPIEKRLHLGDCFMCFSSGSKKHIGKVAYIDADMPYYAGGFMGILRINEKSGIIPKYLYAAMNTENIRNIVRSQSSGANINNLSNSIENTKIPVPSIEQQHQIVAQIEEYEKAIAVARSTMDTCAARKAQILQKYL